MNKTQTSLATLLALLIAPIANAKSLDEAVQIYTDIAPTQTVATKDLIQIFGEMVQLSEKVLAPQRQAKDQKVDGYKAKIVQLRADLQSSLKKCAADSICARKAVDLASYSIAEEERKIQKEEADYSALSRQEFAYVREAQNRTLAHQTLLSIAAKPLTRATASQVVIPLSVVFHADETTRKAFCVSSTTAGAYPLMHPYYCSSFAPQTPLSYAYLYWSKIDGNNYYEEIVYFDQYSNFPQPMEKTTEASVDQVMTTLQGQFNSGQQNCWSYPCAAIKSRSSKI